MQQHIEGALAAPRFIEAPSVSVVPCDIQGFESVKGKVPCLYTAKHLVVLTAGTQQRRQRTMPSTECMASTHPPLCCWHSFHSNSQCLL
jgi:hypothetical protein